MGELVEGVGDEVLLFGVFLVLSFLFVAFLTTRKGGRRTQPPRPSASQDQAAQDEGEQAQPSISSPPVTSSATGTSTSQSSDTEVRSRFHRTQENNTNDPNTDAPQSMASREDTALENEQNELINIRLILPGNILRLQVRADYTLDHLRRSHFQQELDQNCPVRFIYQGRVLNDDSVSLQQLGIADGSAVHMHIGRPSAQGQQANQPVNADAEFLDLSHLFIPLFGVILAIVWVAMLCYPFVFSLVTKLFLFALSLGYVMLTYVTTFT